MFISHGEKEEKQSQTNIYSLTVEESAEMFVDT